MGLDRRVSECYSGNHITIYSMYRINTLSNKLIQYMSMYHKNMYIIPQKRKEIPLYIIHMT